ncbi:MAG: hypothetical protein ACRC92_11225 [Peptostreptococcaceae bacterium]
MALINENTVLEFYLEQLENDNISFLKNKSYFKNVIEKDIKEMMAAESMHDKLMFAKNLWKSLFTASMSYIDSDRRGYDKLFTYFDKYVDFEELIFASDSFYRDHTLHSLWVYFLGEYLYRKDEYAGLFKDKDKYLKSFLKVKEDIDKLPNREIFEDIMENYEDIYSFIDKEESSRCVAALCHDLGYPLRKITQINKAIKSILPYFYIKDINEFNFTYTELEHIYIQSFIEFMSLSIGFRRKEESINYSGIININCNNLQRCGLNLDVVKNFTYEQLVNLKEYTALEINARKKLNRYFAYARSFEEYNHGILSAFLVIKNIKAFENLNFSLGEKDSYFDYIRYSDVVSKQEILRAMTEHTNDSFKIKEISSNVQFLSIIDELEEFSRISRANKNREYVNQYCKTDLNYEDGWFNVNLIFDNENIGEFNPELSFKWRCQRFLTLFDVQNLSKNLKIRVRFIVDMEEKHDYVLEIARNYANIIIDEEEVVIPDYLESYQYCTKKQYMNE